MCQPLPNVPRTRETSTQFCAEQMQSKQVLRISAFCPAALLCRPAALLRSNTLSGNTLVSTGGTLVSTAPLCSNTGTHICNAIFDCMPKHVPHRSRKLNLFGPGAFHIQCVSGRCRPSRLPIGCANQICLGRRLSHPMCGWKGLPKSFPIGRCEFQRCSGTSHGGCEVTEGS